MAKIFSAFNPEEKLQLIDKHRFSTPSNDPTSQDTHRANMGIQRTKTIKNKHAANGSGIKGSKLSKNGPQNDGVIKSKKNQQNKPVVPARGTKGRPKIADILKKRKKRVYSEKELGIPELNKITPVGVQKPKGQKKGKVFVDDRVGLIYFLTLLRYTALSAASKNTSCLY